MHVQSIFNILEMINSSPNNRQPMHHGFLQFRQISVLQGFSPKSIVEQTQIYNKSQIIHKLGYQNSKSKSVAIRNRNPIIKNRNQNQYLLK